MVANVSLLVLLAAGITAGFMGNWWGQGWIWAALGLFILISVTMTLLGSRPFKRLRQFVDAGNPSRSETISHSSLDTYAEKQLAILLDATCDLTISLSSPVTHMLSTVRLSSLPGIPHKIRPVLVLTHICAWSAFFAP